MNIATVNLNRREAIQAAAGAVLGAALPGVTTVPAVEMAVVPMIPYEPGALYAFNSEGIFRVCESSVLDEAPIYAQGDTLNDIMSLASK